MSGAPPVGCLIRFAHSSEDEDRAERLAHAWDMGSAEYIPVPWGSTGLVLGIDSETEDGWAWVEVLAAGRTLLVLSDDMVPHEGTQ